MRGGQEDCRVEAENGAENDALSDDVDGDGVFSSKRRQPGFVALRPDWPTLINNLGSISFSFSGKTRRLTRPC